MEQVGDKNGDKPTLYGAIIMYFPPTILEDLVESDLCSYNEIHSYKDFIEVVYKEVRNFDAWEIDELLTALFAKCNFEEMVDLLVKYKGEILIDISFHHKELYPVLLFSGKNMEIIRSLKADISIDPY